MKKKIMHLCEMETKTKFNRFKCLNQCTNENSTSFMVENSHVDVVVVRGTKRRSHEEEEQWLFALQHYN